jgi:class 3 adenylate cyclase
MIDKFNEYLLAFSQNPNAGERGALEAKIWDEFGVERAVLVLDMSGFSLLSQRYGIIHYLSMVRRMQLTAEPIIKNQGGSVVKFEADNCFAVFPRPLNAVMASILLNTAFDAENLFTPDELDIRISCGIDYGKILLIDDKDFFGNAVNRASKLGEDLAHPGEIFVTREAMDLIPEAAGIEYKPVSLSIGGITIVACLITQKKQGGQS